MNPQDNTDPNQVSAQNQSGSGLPDWPKDAPAGDDEKVRFGQLPYGDKMVSPPTSNYDKVDVSMDGNADPNTTPTASVVPNEAAGGSPAATTTPVTLPMPTPVASVEPVAAVEASETPVEETKPTAPAESTLPMSPTAVTAEEAKPVEPTPVSISTGGADLTVSGESKLFGASEPVPAATGVNVGGDSGLPAGVGESKSVEPTLVTEASVGAPVAATAVGTTTPPATQNPTAEATSGEGEEKKKKGKAVQVIATLALVLLLGGAAGGAYFLTQQTSSGEEGTAGQANSFDTRSRAGEGIVGEETVIYPVSGVVDVDETPEATNSAEVSGVVCKYAGEQPAGEVMFYSTDTQVVYKLSLAADWPAYTIKVPAGAYVAAFKPAKELPVFAYTNYVECGMDPNTCTDHAWTITKYEAGQSYGQANICDPQYADKSQFTAVLAR